jgi:alginate O-acetyltransferase complex protein AlgI
MVFSSHVFLFLFLPAFLALYYLAPFRWRSSLILLGSYVFYAWWRLDFLLLFAGVKLVCWLASNGIMRARERGDARAAKRAMIGGVAGALSALGYFKYFDFGVSNINELLGSMGLAPLSLGHVILPIGISFYTFQAISYVVDVYRGDAKPARNFLDFAAFIGLFPQLVAGPVLRYKDMADQFEEREHSFARFSEGSLRFMIGFCRKVLIADAVAPLVTATFDQPDPTMAEAWLGALAYTVQLYFDFSGYSDMAIGLGLMMGFRFMENFDNPYISRNITEFWRRWHISLSSWLRDYLYVPLGGNRKGARRTYINLTLTMLLGGLWHGANWTFVLWGGWHGAFLAIERRFSRNEGRRRIAPRLGIPLTMFIVILGWVMFRAPNAGAAFDLYAGMFGLNGFALGDRVAWQLSGWSLCALTLGLALVAIAPLWRRMVQRGSRSMARLQVVFVPLFVLALLRLAAQSYSPFLYFQF